MSGRWQHRSKWPLPTWTVTYILCTLITPKFVISAQIYTDTPIQVEDLESRPPPPPPPSNLSHPNNRPTAYALNRGEMRLFYCKHRLDLDRRSSGHWFAWLPELPQPKPIHQVINIRNIYSIRDNYYDLKHTNSWCKQNSQNWHLIFCMHEHSAYHPL